MKAHHLSKALGTGYTLKSICRRDIASLALTFPTYAEASNWLDRMTGSRGCASITAATETADSWAISAQDTRNSTKYIVLSAKGKAQALASGTAEPTGYAFDSPSGHHDGPGGKRHIWRVIDGTRCNASTRRTLPECLKHAAELRGHLLGGGNHTPNSEECGEIYPIFDQLAG